MGEMFEEQRVRGGRGDEEQDGEYEGPVKTV